MGHDHQHHHGKASSVKVLTIAIVLTLAFALVEALTGWWSGSLALLGDAGHMGSDALALAIATVAAYLATKPPSAKHSFGLGRAEVLAAWISSMIMLIISIVVIVEAINRLHGEGGHVKGLPVIIVASLGIIINLFVAWMLSRGERTLNVRAAMLHVIGDLLGSFAALVAGAVIYATGWTPIDPILSILIGVLIAYSSLRLLKESMLVLMEGVPKHINLAKVTETLSQLPGVIEIHDLHIWTLSSGSIMLSAHVHIGEISSWPTTHQALRNTIKKMYDIDHITLQPEPEVFDCNPCK